MLRKCVPCPVACAFLFFLFSFFPVGRPTMWLLLSMEVRTPCIALPGCLPFVYPHQLPMFSYMAPCTLVGCLRCGVCIAFHRMSKCGGLALVWRVCLRQAVPTSCTWVTSWRRRRPSRRASCVGTAWRSGGLQWICQACPVPWWTAGCACACPSWWGRPRHGD